jgi:hypothetical protein
MAIGICNEKLYAGCSVWKDSFGSDTYLYVILFALSGFPILSSLKYMLVFVAMNLFARIFPVSIYRYSHLYDDYSSSSFYVCC